MSPKGHSPPVSSPSLGNAEASTDSTGSSFAKKLRNLPSLSSLRSKKSNSNLKHRRSLSHNNDNDSMPSGLSANGYADRGSVITPTKPAAEDLKVLQHITGNSQQHLGIDHDSRDATTPRQENFSVGDSPTHRSAAVANLTDGNKQPSSSSSSSGQSLGLLMPSDFRRSTPSPTRNSSTVKPPKSLSTAVGAISTFSDDSGDDDSEADHGNDTRESSKTSGTSPSTTIDTVEDGDKNRFSTRRISEWDASLGDGKIAKVVGSMNPKELAAAAAAGKHFSIRPLEEWDGGITFEMLGIEDDEDDKPKEPTQESPRFSVRPDGGWDAKVPLINKSAPRFSVRDLDGWDAKVPIDMILHPKEEGQEALRFSLRPIEGGWDSRLPIDVTGQQDSHDTTSRDRSSTMFSKRPLSGWDAHLTQTIPVLVSSSNDDEDDEAKEATDGLSDKLGSDLSKVPASRADVFSIRGSLSQWDARLAKHLGPNSKLAHVTTPTQESVKDFGERPKELETT